MATKKKTSGPSPTPPTPPTAPSAGIGWLFGPLSVLAVLALGWVWVFCRVYVPHGQTLVVNRVLGDDNPDKALYTVLPEAHIGARGVRERVYGEGYHWFNPIVYNTTTHDRVLEILTNRRKPNHPLRIGVVNSRSGKPLPDGEFLADAGERGVLRRVLTPGQWRYNPKAYEVKEADATEVPPGHVGVQTNQSGDAPTSDDPKYLSKPGERGVMRTVLQPGLYFINPRAVQVDVIEIGYRQLTRTGMSFKSSDGQTIRCDISVVWGIAPRHAPLIVKTIGRSDEDIVNNVINQVLQSASRNEGTKFSSAQLVKGDFRQQFLENFEQVMKTTCEDRGITILSGLVRGIQIPEDIRQHIQNVQIQRQNKLATQEDKKTQVFRNELEQTTGEVNRTKQVTEADTVKMVAEARENGLKAIAKVEATGKAKIAEILSKVAKIEAEIARITGEGEAKVTQLVQEAEADRFSQIVKAFGSPEAYTRYMFAQGLPDDFRVTLRYAGPGTLWTDLPSELKALEKAAAMRILEQRQAQERRKAGRR